MDYCLLVVDFPQEEKAISRKEKAIGAWKHFQIQIGVETKARESQRQEDSMH